ncbi:allantoate amidohydrolase [Arsenicicoccus bolidensis]|uniref:Allantoate amidohydrolase n=1 Tax=Arsenicicoccus bolidensis TaxID=229480 RepID=A0ABS9PYQ5_9MICO|nr:allantoate amidohydrolase [Arsenicicoccus bolidensis]MCG7320771.1 allantoate amidohydrolase [Arsenicicoccus bolidensis]
MSTPTASQTAAHGPAHAELDRMWGELAPVGRDAGSGGYRRFAWTREDATLREWFAGECARRGLDVVEDRAGNQWAWWGDVDAARARGVQGVAIGSHLDSVPDGGAYDGPLGVVTALATVDALRAAGHEPTVPIGVVNFVDEEGARFGVACIGSRVVTGAMTPERALGLRDNDGVTLAEALRDAGRDPDAIGRDDEALPRVGTFVELHVEQGRGLADLDRPVAVGTAIWPHGRWRLDLAGQANHAGTTRLEDRDDPMLRLASAILTARTAATAHGCVATIGKTRVVPGGVNAIPSAVTAWLDARGPVAADVREVVEAVARDSGIRPAAEPVCESWTPETSFDADLAARLSTLLDDAPLLGTGAGHDAGILTNAGVPTAMLFVRNPTGVSHAPDEHAEVADCHAGLDALTAVVTDLAAPAGG